MRFENNFLAEKTKKLKAELFQVKAQLERTSSAKLDEMLNLMKSASYRTDLGYDFFSSNIASSSVFVSLANNVNCENNECKTDITSKNVDKGKSILGEPPKLEKKETRTLGLRRVITKSLNKKSSMSIITVEL